MHLVEVKTAIDVKRFINFPVSLYRNEKCWIRPLDSDIKAVFDPELNSSFKTGSCICWLAIQNKKVVGRMAAFVTRKTTIKGMNKTMGGIGFFECINDQKVADLMFDAGREWLGQQGCTYMDGPVNFGNRDKWWGLLTKGYEMEPNYQFNYNFPYYKKLFENYGFKIYYEHYTFIRDLDMPVHEKLIRKAEIVHERGNYEVQKLDRRRIREQTRHIVEVYNRAWVKHEGVTPITEEQGHQIMSRVKPILDEELIYIAYYKSEPVGMYFNIPDVNQFIKHLNGKINLLGKIKFAWYKWQKKNRKILGFLFGIVPEHQGKGVDGLMIEAMYNTGLRLQPKYRTIEISGIGDFNRKMIIVVKQVGGEIKKVHSTYRYLFDRSAEFKRMKPIR